MKCLLDTSVVIPILNNERFFLDRLQATEAASTSCIVLGEIIFGAHKSARSSENLKRIGVFRDSLEVLPCDAETARIYGDEREKLRRVGRPIPDNDIWIAAQAIQYDLTLATSDRHFEFISQLKTADWQSTL